MIAYFDCFAGIAGDMTVAALIDLGLDIDYLREQLGELDVTSYQVRAHRSRRRGISGTRFNVDIDADQPHRRYTDIARSIEASGLAPEPKSTALRIFDCLADAEATIHGTPKDEVHFHEVGAVDSIVDVVGTAIGLDYLGITEVRCSPLPLSRGFVHTSHGTIPTPAPATLHILSGVPVTGADADIEMVTPTGAAIARTVASSFGAFPSFLPSKTGYGLGTSDPLNLPNALRITIGEAKPPAISREQIGRMECQVDDLDPRLLGNLMGSLLKAGALDVTFTPVQMKKNRPGILVSVFAHADLLPEIAPLLLSDTTTLGVRVSYEERWLLPRRVEAMETSLGRIRVKIVTLPDGSEEKRPEFDDVCVAAEKLGISAREALRRLERELI
jgi:hypothetical protein